MLNVGDRAPGFTLPDQDGILRSLDDYRGKKVILYFYPKDNTSGCSKQACGFAALYPHFTEKNAVVIGISKDTAASHKRFEQNYKLPFILLADTELEAIQAYDVWHEKRMFNKSFMGIIRSTYLISEDGIILKAYDKVKPADNPGQMLADI